MILALDTSTAACTAAFFEGDGTLVASADEVIGRGHAERLVPMVAEMLDGRKPERLLVGCGPGSFTGLRVGIAAAHGMAIGWGAGLAGFSSLALLAAAGEEAEPLVAVVPGGHGELFLQEFGGQPRAALGPLLNLPPAEAAAASAARRAVGPAAPTLVEARGWGEAVAALPSASHVLRLPASLLSLLPQPVYARAPDARPAAAA